MRDWSDHDSQLVSSPMAAESKSCSAWFWAEVVLISISVIAGYVILGWTVVSRVVGFSS